MKRFFYITNAILVVLMLIDNLFFISKSSFSEVINYPSHIVYIMFPFSLIVGIYLLSVNKYEKAHHIILTVYILNVFLSIFVYVYSSLKVENLKILIKNKSDLDIHDINFSGRVSNNGENYITVLKAKSEIEINCKCRNIHFKDNVDSLEYTFIQNGKLKRMIILEKGNGTYADSLLIIHDKNNIILKDDNNILLKKIN